jgi:hypothetical protein
LSDENPICDFDNLCSFWDIDADGCEEMQMSNNGFRVGMYQNLQVEIASVSEWLGNLGLRHEATRVGEYSRRINGLVTALESQETEKYAKAKPFYEMTTSILEAHELKMIHKGLHAYNGNKLLVDKLKKYLKGKTFARDETGINGSGISRNTAFELRLASLFVSSGFDLLLREDVEFQGVNNGKLILLNARDRLQ